MKILFSSYAFAPSVGGIETVSGILAHEFVKAEHEIVLVTETPSAGAMAVPFHIVRQPNIAKLGKLLRWSDVIFQNNISLRHLIPALLLDKRALVVHQTWMRDTKGAISWNARIKRALLGRVTNVAISSAVARDAGLDVEIIGNPYDAQVFQILPGDTRERAILFVGRLVSDKGVALLLRAFAALKQRDLQLTIVGRGPEESRLYQLACELGVENVVKFVGTLAGSDLAQLMNRHQILVIPSQWPEPFGVVALEGIACGCVPVGSNAGGLPEAIGPCGLTFPNGDVVALEHCLEQLLANATLREKFQAAAPAHLERFDRRWVAARYLDLLQQLA